MSKPQGAGAARRDRGSATVEMALALPCVMVLVVIGLSAIVNVADKLGCVARARDVALAAARGEDITGGESIEFRNDGTVVATVETPMNSCESTAAVEP